MKLMQQITLLLRISAAPDTVVEYQGSLPTKIRRVVECTQQSLPSSVNFEYVNKVIIPELHYNNAKMSQFYMRFVRYNSTEWKDIYFVTYAGSIESNLMQMVGDSGFLQGRIGGSIP